MVGPRSGIVAATARHATRPVVSFRMQLIAALRPLGLAVIAAG
jgi:hypothetical protein